MSKIDLDLATVTLLTGSHPAPAGDIPPAELQLCAMEMVAYLAGEPHSDHPQCVCPALTAFVLRLNDRWTDEERQSLKPYLRRLVGTRATSAVERRRVWVLADAAVRIILPAIVDLSRPDLAERLRSQPPITSRESAELSRVHTRKISDLLRVAVNEAWAKREQADRLVGAYAAYAAAYAAYAAADAADTDAADTDADYAYAAYADAAYADDMRTRLRALRSTVVSLSLAALDAALEIK